MGRPVQLIDLGNRRLKLAALEAGGPGAAEALALPVDEAGWPEFAAVLAARLSGAAVRLCSVNPSALERLRGPIQAAADSLAVAGEAGWPMPVRSRGTGADRVLAAAAAWRRCREPLVVADLGTAWTLDLVDGEGCFRGGAIGPGLGLLSRALARACPHLPAAAAAEPAAIPEDSAAAVAAGTRAALADALLAARARMAAAAGLAELRGFLTGGDAGALAPRLEGWTRVPGLVLEGLASWDPAGR